MRRKQTDKYSTTGITSVAAKAGVSGASVGILARIGAEAATYETHQQYETPNRR